ncbi:MAG: GC-type dockerin domain-anchored protein [Phycisphaerales bacterium JB060]
MCIHRVLAAVLSALCVAPLVAAQGDTCEPQFIPGFVGLTYSFVYDMDIEGDHLLFGDRSAYTACSTPDPFVCPGGAVFAYRWIDDRWGHIQTIIPPDLGHNEGFGRTVHVEGDTMMVASGKDGGQVYVYAFNPDIGEWIETDRIYPAPGSYEHFFGAVLAFDSGLAILAQGSLVGGQPPLLHRYVLGEEQWEYRDTFEGPGAPVSNYGKSIRINEDWIIVSADHDRTYGDRHGSVYVYRRNPDDTFEFFQKLLPPEVEAGGPFEPGLMYGVNVAFDGRTLAISAPGTSRDFENQGIIYIYEFDGEAWTLRQELGHSMAGELHAGSFGVGLSVDGDTLVAAMSRKFSRVSFVFRRGVDGRWREVAVVRPTHPEATAFGFISAVEGDRIVIGAPEAYVLDPDYTRYGAAYAYDVRCLICPADLDADGALTIFDFLTFQNLFDAGDMLADFDGDGELTIFDFLAFQTAFDAGC